MSSDGAPGPSPAGAGGFLLGSARKPPKPQDGSDSSSAPSWMKITPAKKVVEELSDDSFDAAPPAKAASPPRRQAGKVFTLDTSSEDDEVLAARPAAKKVGAPSTGKAKSSAPEGAARKAGAKPPGPPKGKGKGEGGSGKAGPAGEDGKVARSGAEVEVCLPDKVARDKILVEVPEDAMGLTDMSGDVGAVGRLLTRPGADGRGAELRLDLKGIEYGAAVVPMATTVLVVATGAQGGAGKVEALFSDFLQLREERNMYAEKEWREGGDADWTDDDSEGYAAAADPDGGDGAKKGKKAKGKAKPRAGAGGKAKPAARKKATGAKGGVAKRQGGGKGRGAGKGRGK
ncbi:unnamed protein product [Pedinophyceae sp. YPF-701]|nr:unnamed protein product [Pedinophyceae sp. YPF-701]